MKYRYFTILLSIYVFFFAIEQIIDFLMFDTDLPLWFGYPTTFILVAIVGVSLVVINHTFYKYLDRRKKK